MAAFRTGDTLVWIIGPVQDDVGAAITGASFSAVVARKPDGTSFAPTYTEIGSGVYQATVVSTMRGNWYLYSQATVSGVVYGDTGSITVDDELAYTASGSAGSVGAALANLDAAVSSRLPTTTYVPPSGTAVFTAQPIALNGTITLYKRNDYKNAETRSLDWSTTDAGTWPDLTGATIAFASIPTGGALADGLRATGSVLTPTGATKAVRVEITALQSRTAKSGGHGYQLRATLTNGDVVTLAAGNLKVLEYIG